MCISSIDGVLGCYYRLYNGLIEIFFLEIGVFIGDLMEDRVVDIILWMWKVVCCLI